MRELGQVRGRAFRRSAQRLQHLPVQHQAPVRPDRLLDREPRQFVAERHRAALTLQHAGLQACVDVLDLVAEDLVEEPDLRARRHDRDCLERGLGGAAEPAHAAEHRVAHRRRDVRAASGEDLGDEERIAAGLDVELLGIEPVRARRAPRPRRARATAGAGASRPARCRARRPRGAAGASRASSLVPVGDDDERAERLGAPGEQSDDVERRLIRPVQVLDHDDRRAQPHAARRRARRRPRAVSRLRARMRSSIAVRRRRDVGQRTQRPRRLERVARAPEHACARSRARRRSAARERSCRSRPRPRRARGALAGRDSGEVRRPGPRRTPRARAAPIRPRRAPAPARDLPHRTASCAARRAKSSAAALGSRG